jgi:hypothetical protein
MFKKIKDEQAKKFPDKLFPDTRENHAGEKLQVVSDWSMFTQKGIIFDERNKYATSYFHGYKIPHLLFASHFQLFAASNKKLCDAVTHIHRYQKNDQDFEVEFSVLPAYKLRMIKRLKLSTGTQETSEPFCVGRLNDTDLRVWSCILKVARDQYQKTGTVTGKIFITRYQIAKMLGWKTIATKEYKYIEESLYRLTNCPLKYERENLTTGENEIFNLGSLLEAYSYNTKSGTYATKGIEIDMFCNNYVIIHRNRISEIASGFITAISFDLLMQKLSTPLERAIYNMLNTKNTSDSTIYISLQDIKGYTGQVKLTTKKVLLACEKLIKHKFLVSATSIRKNLKAGYTTYIKFVKNLNYYKQEQVRYEIANTADAFYQIIMCLLEIGKTEASELIDKFDERDLIDYCKFVFYKLEKGDAIENRKAYLINAIRGKYTLSQSILNISTNDILNWVESQINVWLA